MDEPQYISASNSKKSGMEFIKICVVVWAAVSFHGKAIADKSIHKRALRHSKSLKIGKRAFQEGNYKKAKDYFRLHLRKYKKDYDSWNYLAASYYHLGLPKRTIRYLKYVYHKTRLKSFNLLYRGISYRILKKNAQAIKMLKRSMEFHDEYGSMALLELALLHYHAQNKREAEKWGSIYLKRYPKGTYASAARRMIDSIELGHHMPDLAGIAGPNMNKAKFNYHNLSLFNFPHFWLLQLGTEAFRFTGMRPDSGRTLKSHQNQVFGILANFGLGVGPIRSDFFSFWAGYIYHQRWLTNFSRVETYLQDVADIAYLPFRPDLLERTHRLAANSTVKISPDLNLGLYSSFNYKIIGSDLSDPAGYNSLKGRIPISKSLLFIPWVGISYLNNFRNFFYLYMEKTIDDSSSHFSNTTWGYDGDDFFTSGGLRQVINFDRYDLSLQFDLFFIPYMFNDRWLDFNRSGGTAKIKTELLSRIGLAARFGYFSDNYALDVLKLGGCETPLGEEDKKTLNNDTPPQQCPREARAIMLEFSGSFDLSATKRIELSVVHVTNSDLKLEEYSRTETKFKVWLTFAFPSAEKTLSYVDKFSDAVYLIGREDYGYIR